MVEGVLHFVLNICTIPHVSVYFIFARTAAYQLTRLHSHPSMRDSGLESRRAWWERWAFRSARDHSLQLTDTMSKAKIRGTFCDVCSPATCQLLICCGAERVRTYGNPQYVHQHTCGLSTLMKIFGCPNGPPPPSQATDLPSTHRTGCLCMSSIAANGRGFTCQSLHMVMEVW
jgi:hypothetical protein